jgi:hypothetical protein
VRPEALNAYQLQPMGTTGPISQTPYANSGTSNAQTYPILFCDYAPTPSVSSKGNMLLQPENVVLTATRLCHPFLD